MTTADRADHAGIGRIAATGVTEAIVPIALPAARVKMQLQEHSDG